MAKGLSHKKSPMKDPLSFIGLFAYSMPKGSFPLPGSLKIPDPHKKSKKSGACFSQLSRNASYNFSMISTSLSLPYTLCMTAQASCYDTLMRIRYISFCLYHSMKKRMNPSTIHPSCALPYIYFKVCRKRQSERNAHHCPPKYFFTNPTSPTLHRVPAR